MVLRYSPCLVTATNGVEAETLMLGGLSEPGRILRTAHVVKILGGGSSAGFAPRADLTVPSPPKAYHACADSIMGVLLAGGISHPPWLRDDKVDEQFKVFKECLCGKGLNVLGVR